MVMSNNVIKMTYTYSHALIKTSRKNINFKKQSLIILNKQDLSHKNFRYESNLLISVNFKPCFKLFFPS